MGDLQWLRDVAMVALTALLAMLGVLLKMVHGALREEVKEVRSGLEEVKDDLQLNYVSQKTWARMDNDWKDEVQEMRAERRERDKENADRHRENTAHLERISDSLVKVVELAVLMKGVQEEIEKLRDSKHDIAELVQNHEGRLHFLEKK